MQRQVLLIFLIGLFLFKATAQERETDTLFDESSKTFLPIPLIINNPTFKTGFGMMPMFFFKFNKEDKISPPSMLTLTGIYSTNKSYVFIPAARLYWNEDKNRATIITGAIRINNDFIYENDEGDDIRLVYSEL